LTWKLQDKEVQEKFEKRVGELVDVEKTNLWESFRDGVLEACNEICGKKKVQKNREDNWWWNEEVVNAIARKKHSKSFAIQGWKRTKLHTREYEI